MLFMRKKSASEEEDDDCLYEATQTGCGGCMV